MTATVLGTARGRVEVATIGEGPAVLVIHGTPGNWRQVMTLAEDLAEAGHSVVVPSRPGYGRTPATSGRTPDEQADLFAAALDTLGMDRAAAIGISGGGPSAVAFAQRHPQRTSALALLCAVAPHLIDVPTAMRIGAALPPLAWAVSTIQRRQQRRMLDDDAAIDARIHADLSPSERDLLAADPGLRADLVRFLRSHADGPAGLAGLRNDVAAMRAARRDGPQATDEITAPALVAHGDADVVVPFAHAEHHARAITGARLERFADASHIFLLTHRRRTTDLLLDHLGAAR